MFILEELLIDFQELVGEHSGDNMADSVWETLERYGLVGRVSGIGFVAKIKMRLTKHNYPDCCYYDGQCVQ
jgi:hypothetical protein